jgi:hypothetical protein
MPLPDVGAPTLRVFLFLNLMSLTRLASQRTARHVLGISTLLKPFAGDFMAGQAEFMKHYEVIDSLIEQSTREQLAESMLLLSLVVAQYQLAHGKIPLMQASSFIQTNLLDDNHLKVLAAGMENAIGVLHYVAADMSQTRH